MSIHIEDLTVRFKNSVTAIDHADLDIPNGIFGLLGENGAGKTTLMEISHRAKDFQPVVDEAVALFKELLNIPEGYSVLFFIVSVWCQM